MESRQSNEGTQTVRGSIVYKEFPMHEDSLRLLLSKVFDEAFAFGSLMRLMALMSAIFGAGLSIFVTWLATDFQPKHNIPKELIDKLYFWGSLILLAFGFFGMVIIKAMNDKSHAKKKESYLKMVTEEVSSKFTFDIEGRDSNEQVQIRPTSLEHTPQFFEEVARKQER